MANSNDSSYLNLSETTDSSDTHYMLAPQRTRHTPDFQQSSNKHFEIQKFKGLDSKIKIENWLRMYERIIRYMNWSDEESIIHLFSYLEDDALEWFSGNLDTYNTFNDVKGDLMAQYGVETEDPLRKACDTRYNFKEGLKPYFNNIRRYAALAGLDMRNTLSLLKRNLPFNILDFIGGTPIQDYNQFCNIVRAAEENIARKRNEIEKRKFFHSDTKPCKTLQKPASSSSFNSKHKQEFKSKKSVPPKPCRICENLGFQSRYHWMSECRNKTSKDAKAKEVNNCEVGDDTFDINKINLDLN